MVLIFNDIAGSEILLILVFVLIFFGSKSIPTLARTFGRTIRQIKDASADIQTEIKKSGMDMKKDLNLSSLIEDTAKDIRKPLDQMAVDIDRTMKYEPRKVDSRVPPVKTSTESEEISKTPENIDSSKNEDLKEE